MKSVTTNLKHRLNQVGVLIVALVLPVVGMCQPSGPGDAGNPDEVVPFDPNMNLVFLALGVCFAAFILVRQRNRKAAKAA